jgi:hypothetical protein
VRELLDVPFSFTGDADDVHAASASIDGRCYFGGYAGAARQDAERSGLGSRSWPGPGSIQSAQTSLTLRGVQSERLPPSRMNATISWTIA